ncbi:MAG: BlaI/MecI/CopY family transcriptional regulator [Candidatus Hydrogenedentes bacterium]|nr:BlaI/MecI/CopY family transcriptional regulator [Candidatus Hydrogenedentota bacterium]
MPELNENELEAMRVLWEKGPSKPSDIQEEFAWPIENATLRSVLRVLVEKGHVSRRKEGKAFVYRARSSQRGILASMARMMARVCCGGDPAHLIAQLIRMEKLSDEELLNLRRIANESNSMPRKRR